MADVIDAESLLVLADRKNSVFDGQVFAGEDEVDAGMGSGARSVDASNARVRVRGAQELAVHHARKGNVVGEASLASDFGACVYAPARMADYAEIAIASVGFLVWRIALVRHRRS